MAENNQFDIPQEVLADFSQVEKFLYNSSLFKNIRKVKSDTGILTVHGDANLLFVQKSIWGNAQKLAKLKEKTNSPSITLLYVVAQDDFHLLPDVLKNSDHFKIVTPISAHNFHTAISSVIFLQYQWLTIVNERLQTNKDIEDIQYVLSVSRQLNGVRDVPKLLNLILEKAREITSADAGTIYEVEIPTENIREGIINFCFAHNHSVAVKQDLSSSSLPISESTVVGSCVIHKKSINASDLYQYDNANAVQHDRSFDERLNYQTHSMLTTPIFDISRQVIGVIQLLNRKLEYKAKLITPEDYRKQVVPFSQRDIDNVEIVAQQSGIALENARMQDEIIGLFDGFVDASVTAIEQRDPTTSGHSHRVAAMTLDLAKTVNDIDIGKYRKLHFTEEQMTELRYASLLHDFGKLGVREQVLVKAKKLYPWQLDLLRERFKLIKSSYEVEYLRQMLELSITNKSEVKDIRSEMYLRDKNKRIEELEEYFEFIQKTNEPTVTVGSSARERAEQIAERVFRDIDGEKRHFLTEEDLQSLSITKGSLSADEFYEIQGHVNHTYMFLRKIPWGKKFANIPDIAAKHHEKLDGSGYPNKITDIPVQSRMMTIADIFDALTASDRPYKKSLSPERALQIMDEEVRAGKLDSTLFDIFVESKRYLQVVQKVD